MHRLLFTFMLVSCFTSSAQTCCSGGIPLSNNIGLDFLEKGSLQIGINYDYNYLNTLHAGTANLNDDSRLRVTHSGLLNFGYAITNNFSAEVLLTWVNQRRKIVQIGTDLDQTSGIGDGIILMKYKLTSSISKNHFAIGFGTKLPFGSSTETDGQGITFNADLQPGSGAYDLIYFTQFSHQTNFRPSLSIGSRIVYRTTGTNNDYLDATSYKFGNELQAYLGFTDQFLLKNTLIGPSITFKYRHADLDKIGGSNLNNTGGDWVFVIPTISINLKTGIDFLARAELPVYSNVYGTQLTPTYRLTTGLLFTITPKQFENSML